MLDIPCPSRSRTFKNTAEIWTKASLKHRKAQYDPHECSLALCKSLNNADCVSCLVCWVCLDGVSCVCVCVGVRGCLLLAGGGDEVTSWFEALCSVHWTVTSHILPLRAEFLSKGAASRHLSGLWAPVQILLTGSRAEELFTFSGVIIGVHPPSQSENLMSQMVQMSHLLWVINLMRLGLYPRKPGYRYLGRSACSAFTCALLSFLPWCSALLIPHFKSAPTPEASKVPPTLPFFHINEAALLARWGGDEAQSSGRTTA